MKITGQILKENRERKGVTLSEVSLSTKITIKTLVAIEEADPINLPPKTFLRGFVRSYAIFLGVDVEEILRTFQEEMGSTLSRPAAQDTLPSEMNAAATDAVATSGETPATTPAAPNQPIERRAKKRVDAEAALRDETSLVTKGGIVGGILLLIILIVFLKEKMDSYESERATPYDGEIVAETIPRTVNETGPGPADVTGRDGVETKTAESKQVVAPPSTATPAPAAIAPPSATATPRATATATPVPTATPQPTATPRPSATPAPSPTPKATSTPVPTPAATASPAPSSTPQQLGAAPAGKSHEILIEALDQVDIEVTADGEAARKFQLRGDQIQSIKVKRKANLRISDGGAVNIIVNGVDRGVPGDLGKPTRVELP